MANFDDYDVEIPGHEPEEGILTVYCDDCDITYALYTRSYPGDRDSEPTTCPDCRKLLGGRIETEWKVLERQQGDMRHPSMVTA